MGLLTKVIMPLAMRKKDGGGSARSSTASGGGGGIAEKQRESAGDAEPLNLKRGGKVKRTGMARVHKGERVLTKRQAKRYRRGSRKR